MKDYSDDFFSQHALLFCFVELKIFFFEACVEVQVNNCKLTQKSSDYQPYFIQAFQIWSRNGEHICWAESDFVKTSVISNKLSGEVGFGNKYVLILFHYYLEE